LLSVNEGTRCEEPGCSAEGTRCHASCCMGEMRLCTAHRGAHDAQFRLDAIDCPSGYFGEVDAAQLIALADELCPAEASCG
jgi:hypothetical protein